MNSECSQTEAARLAALRRYEILDTEPEEVFDDLARVAALVCNTPVAVISLIDDCRQWFKARVGVEAKETSRSIAFCDYAIREPDRLLVVPDATADPNFRDNPLVTGDTHIRFYAGAPLVTPDGYALGTLCAIDRRPRELTPEQAKALSTLARHVVTQIELRREIEVLKRTNAKLADQGRDRRLTNDSVVHLCGWTRAMRVDDGPWVSVEEFLRGTLGARVVHSISDEAIRRMSGIHAVISNGVQPAESCTPSSRGS
jgi:GAF domain-containing protein